MCNKFLLRCLLLTAVLCGLSSCMEEPQAQAERPELTSEHPTTAVVVQVVEKAAAKAATLKMKAISPNTGRTPKYSYDMGAVVYDRLTQHATVALKVSWTAKKAELSDTRNLCEIAGTLSVNFVNRASGAISATYMPSACNDWVKQCLSYIGRPESTAYEVLTFDPYK